jgi:CubicO group peptidase (beta-lactamase class C family)
MLSAMSAPLLAGTWSRSRAGFGAALGAVVLLAVSSVGAQPGTASSPGRLPDIDRVVEAAIAAGQTPGAVVLVGRGSDILHFEAYGVRATVPSREPMTLDTVFDLASLTKVVATTTAMMTLVEQGRVRLSDPVSTYVPGFERYGKGAVTVGHLMAHTSGLRPDLDLAEPWKGYDTAIELARGEVLRSAPGERFVYSDINYFLLGDIVRVVSGEPLEAYTRRVVFGPLRMPDTGFLPAASLRPRIAPTERCDEMDQWPCKRPDAAPLRGVVHDPTARRMGGVAGHAGLFGTTADLARFARMLLGGGVLEGARVLAPATVARMTSRATPPGMAAVRGLGWDIDSSFSSPRGELFPVGSFGHTGFTGTSLWIDPASGGYVIILASRLHPDGGGDMTPLRARVATIAAAAMADVSPAPRSSTPVLTAASPAPAPSKPVLSGIDVLERDGFARLKGRRVGLLTNHTGVDRSGASSIDVLRRGLGPGLVALFSPEHGIRGNRDDENVASEKDAKTGLTIHSLYGATRRPTDDMLTGIDTIVVDLADVGARFYTYPVTMAYVLEEAAKRKIAVVVLDRPNPINGCRLRARCLTRGSWARWFRITRCPFATD